MLSKSILLDEDSPDAATDIRSNPSYGLHFPESFSRTSPAQDDDPMSDASPLISPVVEPSPSPTPYHHQQTLEEERSPSPASNQRSARGSVMRLENILNEPDFGRQAYRSRSLCASPTHSEMDVLSAISVPLQARSVSPAEKTVRKKKVKMHRCLECQKEFPRPSGLRTHMNMHTKEKPFPCTYPGCSRTFSVVSNAKRHMRTHGVGVTTDDQLSTDTSVAVPYVVGFEAPVVIAAPAHGLGGATMESEVKEPVKLRWVSSSAGGGVNGIGIGIGIGVSASTSVTGSATTPTPSVGGSASGSGSGFGSGSGTGSGYSSAGSSRARSLSGAGDGTSDLGVRIVNGLGASGAGALNANANGGGSSRASVSVGRKEDLLRVFPSASTSDRSMSGPPSPNSYSYSGVGRGHGRGDSDEDGDDGYRFGRLHKHRRVESEGSSRVSLNTR